MAQIQMAINSFRIKSVWLRFEILINFGLRIKLTTNKETICSGLKLSLQFSFKKFWSESKFSGTFEQLNFEPVSWLGRQKWQRIGGVTSSPPSLVDSQGSLYRFEKLQNKTDNFFP